jgi:hypothetical protein
MQIVAFRMHVQRHQISNIVHTNLLKMNILKHIGVIHQHPEMEYKNVKHPNPLYENYSINISRQFSEGNYNVYVIIPDDHPDVGKSYDDIEIETHYTMSFSGGNMFGIDFAHKYDFTLETTSGRIYDETKVWTFEEVKAEGFNLIERFYARAH